MRAIDYREFDRDYVFYFGSKDKKISANTLAESLSALSLSLELINDEIYPGSRLKVEVHAVGEGSFKLKLSHQTKKFMEDAWESAPSVPAMVLAGLILNQCTADSPGTNITINGDVMIIQNQENQVILPGNLQNSVGKLSKNKDLSSLVSKNFQSLNRNEDITSFGIARSMDDSAPNFQVERESFSQLCRSPEELEELGEKEVFDDVEVKILRAVFERGKRRWEFVYQDRRISAPILDSTFYDDLELRKIVIGDGDTLSVTLRTTKEWNEIVGVWIDKSYAVIKVYSHTKGITQGSLDME